MKITNEILKENGYETLDNLNFRKRFSISEIEDYTLIITKRDEKWDTIVESGNNPNSITVRFPFQIIKTISTHVELSNIQKTIIERIKFLLNKNSK